MSYSFTNLKSRLKEVEDWLTSEFQSIRVGRATPALLDHIMVKSYDTKQAIKHIASISIDDPKTLRITPWDKSLISDIQSAINAANLGVSTSPDATSVRVSFPELTEEKRQSLIKVAGDKAEDAKISIRKEREKVLNDISDKAKGGEISEDDKFRLKEEMQKIIDEEIKKLESILEKKKTEIKS